MAMPAPTSTAYKLNYSRRKFTDDALHRLSREVALRQDSYQYEEVDFSQNEMSSTGLRVVLDVCRRCPKLRVLKLYKNHIDDGGAKGLAELCGQCPAIEEIHLSHNHFTAAGVETLIAAAEQVRPDHISPLWLRLEQNDVLDAEAVFRDLQSRLSVCMRQDENKCTARYCCRKMKIHLPFFDMQRNARYRSATDRPEGPPAFKMPDNAQVAGPSFRVPRGEGSPAVPMRSVATPKSSAPVSNGVNAWGMRTFSGPLSPATNEGGDSSAPDKPLPAWGGAAPAGVFTSANGSGATAAQNGASAALEPVAPPPKAPAPAAAPMAAVRADTPKRDVAGTTVGPGPGGTQDASPTPQRQRKAAQDEPTPAAATGDAKATGGGGSSRASVVLDQYGRRRILPKQLEAEDHSAQFVCPLCTYVTVKPVVTSCSHLSCDTCFRNWVGDQVAKMKKGLPADGPVPLIPCPYPRCNTKLRKKDITDMSAADSTKVGAVQLLQRLRNNLAVRCVHHSDHFKYPFGAEAERIAREKGITCKWLGGLMDYEDHLGRHCEIERHLQGLAGVTELKGNEPAEVPVAAAAATAAKAPPPPPKAHAAAPVMTSMKNVDATGATVEGEVRRARYDYNPREGDKGGQIFLKANDFVKIFEVTESGWAAGVRLCKETKQEDGDAGWFPAGYLYPADHDAPENATP